MQMVFCFSKCLITAASLCTWVLLCVLYVRIYICNEPNNLHLMSFYLPTQYSPYKRYADRLLHFQEFASTNKQTRAQYIVGRFKLIENSFIPNWHLCILLIRIKCGRLALTNAKTVAFYNNIKVANMMSIWRFYVNCTPYLLQVNELGPKEIYWYF